MKSLLGGLLLAVGILLAGVSGLCSLAFLVMGIGDGGLADILPLLLVVGGLPFVIGVGLFFGGRSLLRSARQEQEEGASPDS